MGTFDPDLSRRLRPRTRSTNYSNPHTSLSHPRLLLEQPSRKIEQLQHQLHAAQQESIEASREQELARTTLLAALDAGKEDAQRVYDNADRNAKQAAELVQYHSDEIETQRKELAELERKQILDAKEKLASVSVDEATGQVTSAAPAHPAADKPLTQKMKEQLARYFFCS